MVRCVAVSALVVAGLVSCSRSEAPPAAVPPPAPKRPHVVLIVVDTLRADRVGLYGHGRPTTPAIDRFFGGGLVFEAAHTPISFTAPAVMSLLTGLRPPSHGVRMIVQHLPAERPTLPDHLRRAGYHAAAVVSNMVLTDEFTGLGRRFDYYDDFVDRDVAWPGKKRHDNWERNAAGTTDAALEWLGKARALDQPHFLWLHYMDPHGPYAAPPDKPVDFAHDRPHPIDPARVPEYNRISGGDDGAEYVDRYDEEIAYADREIARFLAAYERAFGTRDTLFLFTSDHGETHMEEAGRFQWFTHGHQFYTEEYRVPLVLRGPGIAGGRRADPVSLLDVMPTVLERAGLAPEPGLDGRSLLAAPDPHRELLLEGMGAGRGQRYRALLRGGRKWVMLAEGAVEVPAGRVYYDLVADPAESRPQPWPAEPASLLAAFRTDPDVAGVSRQILVGERLKGPKRRPDGGLPVVSSSVDPEAAERLRALGYVR